MKKLLFSFISFPSLSIILLTFSTLVSGTVHAISRGDTAWYYSERGKLLWRDVQALTPASYIIRTKKTDKEIFHEIPQDDSSMQLSDDYNTAKVNGIQRRTARKVRRLIRHGAVNDPLVVENIVPVLDKRIIRRMYDNIISRCTSSDAHRYKEHGGVVLPDGTVTCITGELSDPRWLQGAALMIKEKALVYYHSHPDGYLEEDQSNDGLHKYNPNRVQFSQTSHVQTISYIQAPSRQDQESVGEGTGYVFGMKGNGGLIYIYNKDGIMATLPMSFVKKMRKSKAQKAQKVDTYFAGIFPALPLSYLF